MSKITSRDENFAEWYLDVIREADLAESSPVRGSMIIKPHGYALWENTQKILDNEFKKRGTQNVYFPLLIPKSFLEKEAEHVEGFAKECAVVTHHRLEEKDGKLVPAGELDEPFVIRPTSETIIYDAFSKWIHSYRDLPLIINQWCNVMRWEMRPRLFLRTTEFLWQEGHTAHATRKEADEKTLEMLEVYREFVEEYLAISLIKGKKTESEKFPGAEYTSTIEAMMQDGKALQSGTSHMLAQNFAKSFDVSFLDENQKKQYVWQTSWGLSTRIIGALIMSHSDDKGFVLPPRIAPMQVVIIPIWSNADDKKSVFAEVQKIKTELEAIGIKYKVDEREGRPGFKYFEWERKGIPFRIEIGPKDIQKQSVVVVERLSGKKEFVSNKELSSYLKEGLEHMQTTLLENSKRFRLDNTREVSDYEEFKKVITKNPGFIFAHLCLDKTCEEKIKEETNASTRCIPFEGGLGNVGKCIYCKKNAPNKVLFAKAY
ncbi:MAG: proline--tRNA ligase [Parcubacteria group bacterium CG1_02_37_51]|uniref:Proline--tRNA ligase n=2 Tax=Candidatus Komeiliibacteriota TaxID=1817908 RepID=A0A2M8DRU1_9BACT|nr:MAG: proline--tRNA ligase [Parcubacteria group bacterium CG1_02_37_51]PIY94380.1 MAG: proline--tRNA ligase [Candidatus Komeilibacteria bacterium CG_4_10_14_0_8_um_filter_37_78]PJC02095.1 MAG: proline--tRNA ligase [Candidatus Komeilibacteria bacterium CG_4_9_14_0_8_um_filter_36_9]